MTVQNKVQIGETILENILTTTYEKDPELLEETERLKKDCGYEAVNRSLNFEDEFIELAREIKINMNYPQIDISFLARSRVIDYKYTQIQVPRFTVHKLFEKEREKIVSTNGTIEQSVYEKASNIFMIEFKNALYLQTPSPRKFEEQLQKSTEPYYYKENDLKGKLKKEFKKNKKKLITKYKKISDRHDGRYDEYYSLEFKLEFKGIMDFKARKKLEQSLEYFNKDKLYIITEPKEEDWKTGEIKTSPSILVAEFKNNIYFITQFETKQIDNYKKITNYLEKQKKF